jgi:hypothetical protein
MRGCAKGAIIENNTVGNDLFVFFFFFYRDCMWERPKNVRTCGNREDV